MLNKNIFIQGLKNIVGSKYVLTAKWSKETYSRGWRYGEGEALAVIKPKNLVDLWNVLKVCVKDDVIIIMQGANTGLTGG